MTKPANQFFRNHLQAGSTTFRQSPSGLRMMMLAMLVGSALPPTAVAWGAMGPTPPGDTGDGSGCEECSGQPTGEGEQCDDAKDCECPDGNAPDGPADPGTPVKPAIKPVDRRRGDKWENVVDVRVRVPGTDFSLRRVYNSNTGLDGYMRRGGGARKGTTTGFDDASQMNVGSGWSIGNLRAIWAEGSHRAQSLGTGLCSSPGEDFRLIPQLSVSFVQPGRTSYRGRTVDLTASFGFDGAGNQNIVANGTAITYTTCDPVPTGSTWSFMGPVTVTEPGVWRQKYGTLGVSVSTPSGILWLEDQETLKGQSLNSGGDGYEVVSGKYYRKRTTSGGGDVTSAPIDVVFLNGTPDTDLGDANDPLHGDDAVTDWDAKIELDFVTSDSRPRLGRVSVYRPDEAGVNDSDNDPYTLPLLTQEVVYYYYDDVSGTMTIQELDDSGSTLAWKSVTVPSPGPSVDLGTDGDLVLISAKELQSDGQFGYKATHYRYHDDSPTAGPEGATGSDVIDGDPHQLKLVVQPQQIEFAAQKTATGTVTETMVRDEAIELLALADSGTVYTESSVDTELMHLASKVIDYADQYIDVNKNEVSDAGETRWRVERQYLQASDCGCGGGAFEGIVREYSYLEWEETVSLKLFEGQTCRIDERVVGSSITTRAYTFDYREILAGTEVNEGVLYLLYTAVLDMDDTAGTTIDQAWATGYLYNTDRQRAETRSPSVFTAFTPGASGTPPSKTQTDTEGLATKYNFEATDGGVATVKVGPYGSVELVQKSTYYALPSPLTGVRSDLIATIERYPDSTATSLDNDIELVSVDYEFIGGLAGDENAPVRVRTVEREHGRSVENGPGGTQTFKEVFDDLGRVIWYIDPEGVCTKYEYDDSIDYSLTTPAARGGHTGRLVKVTQNADPIAAKTSGIDKEFEDLGLDDLTSDPFSGITQSGDTLVTEYSYDALGRRTKVVYPGGTERYTSYEMIEDDQRSGILSMATVQLPYENPSVSEVAGPATISWRDAGNKTTRFSSYEINLGVTYTPDAATPVYATDGELSRSTVVRSRSGSVERRHRWWEISLYGASTDPSASDYVDTTSYEYDAFGRTTAVVDAAGNRTERTYDVLDRVKTVKSGIDSAPSNLQEVAEYYYDGAQEASTLADGTGNGNLTTVVLHEDGSATRQFSYYYDDRDRRIATVGPDKPYRLTKYDNLNRPTHRMLAGAILEDNTTTVVTGIPTQDDIEHSAGLFYDGDNNDLWLEQMFYDQQGRIYRSQAAIDATAGTLAFLSSDWWYGEDGDVIASTSPNSPSVQIERDELGRTTAVYSTDLAHTADHATAASLTGRTVLDEYEYSYASDNTLELATRRMRLHDDTGTDALDVNDSVTTYTHYRYDFADRVQAVVDLGTTEDGFESPTADPTAFTAYDTYSKLLAADDVLFQWLEYDARGQVKDRKSPRDAAGGGDVAVTRSLFDDAGRLKGVIEKGYQATATTIVLTWDNTDERWEPSGYGTGKPDDEDRVTTFSYNGLGSITHRVAWFLNSIDNPEPEDTEYVYGVTTGATFGSGVDSNRLLAEVHYPLAGNGNPDGTNDRVQYKYNRLGEMIGMIDQLGTERRFDRDSSGRVTADAVVTPAASIDSAVRAHVYRYDTAGRLDQASAYDDPDEVDWSSTTIVNQVTMEYSSLWQLETIKQNPDGLTSSAGETVTYAYTEDETNNHSRLNTLMYPSETGGTATMKVKYGAASSTDDLISRVSSLQVDDLVSSPTGYADLVKYEYLGLGLPTFVNYPEAGGGISLDRSVGRDSTDDTLTQTSGLYPAFDRFGRLQQQLWTRESITAGTTKAAYFDELHSYDRASNRLSRVDSRYNASYAKRDQVFDYDNLNRLSEVRWGAVSSPYADHDISSIGSPTDTREWELDLMGNTQMLNDLEGTTVEAEWDFTVNNSNEYIKAQVSAPTGKALPVPTPVDHRYTTDKNGNRSTFEYDQTNAANNDNRFIYTYDAWNRLVTVEYRDEDLQGFPPSPTTTTVAVYEYNALHWRTLKRADTSDGAYNGLDQERRFYYSASWQLLEEHVDESYTSTFAADRISQQFWGTRYIDDAVAKRMDSNADGDYLDTASPADSTWYYLTDSQFSVRQVVDEFGALYERLDYTPYGEARHSFAADINRVGGVNAADFATYPSGTYNPDWDFNADGVTDSADVGVYAAQNAHGPLPDGWISEVRSSATEYGPDNSIGYAGYVNNAEISMYTVRFRILDPATQRWMTRDPIGYADSMNMYQYGLGSPGMYIDPFGLITNQERGCNLMDAVEESCGLKPGDGKGLADAMAKELATQVRKRLIAEGQKALGEAADNFGRLKNNTTSDSARSIFANDEARARRAKRYLRRLGKGLTYAGTGLALKDLAESMQEGDGLGATSNAFKLVNDGISYFPAGWIISVPVDVLSALGEGWIDDHYMADARSNADTRNTSICKTQTEALADTIAKGFDTKCCD